MRFFRQQTTEKDRYSHLHHERHPKKQSISDNGGQHCFDETNSCKKHQSNNIARKDTRQAKSKVDSLGDEVAAACANAITEFTTNGDALGANSIKTTTFCRRNSENGGDQSSGLFIDCKQSDNSRLLTQVETRRFSLCPKLEAPDQGADGISVSGMAMVSGQDADAEVPRAAFCCVGLHKGSVVAIKYIRKRHVDLTRSIRKELKQVI